ncbi:MAG: hypothetical protein DI604_15065 [Delftia acidovorans]|nr:MAG: hypothetical protein DI604_15065 [Delftia acidovorans]
MDRWSITLQWVGSNTLCHRAWPSAFLLALATGLPPQAALGAEPARPAYAELRVRIVDSGVLLDGPSPTVAAHSPLAAKLDAVKAAGAMEKRSWAEYNARLGVLLPFIANKTINPQVLFSPDAQASAIAPSGELAGVAIASFDSRPLKAGSLNFAVPGTGRALASAPKLDAPSPARIYGLGAAAHGSSGSGDPNPELLKLKNAVEKLERRPSSNAHDEGAAIAQDAQLAFPLSSIPFGPTPAAYSVTVRVTCDDLAKYLPLLKEQGTELKFSACDQEHPQVSLMTVQFDLPGLDTVDEALPNPNPPSQPAPAGNLQLQSAQAGGTAVRDGLDALPPASFVTRIRELLRSPPASKTTPILVIVDDGFPSQEAYLETKKFFDEADEFLRKTYQLPLTWYSALPPDPYQLGIDAELKALPDNTAGPRGLQGCTSLQSKSCRLHSKGIEKSLQVFTQLVEGPQPVRVIWIPLVFAQPGAAALAYRLHRFSKVVPDEFLSERQQFSAKNLDSIQQEFFYMLSRKGVGYPETSADWAISRTYFGSILNYLRAYSAKRDTPVFVNLSWRTAADQSSSLPGRGRSWVMLVAAAGNPCTPDKKCERPTVVDDTIDSYNFLKFATYEDPSSFVVANVNATGQAVCNTARLDARDGTLAFPGGISDDCGTSFSAPRIAWLLAANERYSSAQDRNPDEWALGLRTRVASGRDPKACALPHNMSCLMPTPERLFPGLGLARRGPP